MHEVKKVLATLVKTSEHRRALESRLKETKTNLACSKITGTLETLQSRNWYTNCTTDDSPSNADDDATIPVAKHVAAQCFQWYDSVSRCTTSSSSQASGAGAASTNLVASCEWRMEVCRCIVNLISIVKLSDFQFHMCVVIEILKKVSWGACRAGGGFRGQKLLVQV